ncbi:hypothetical protein B0T17DRAFT_540292 [Bombardia bombarda]|uniref:Uncharacterized protein n=1 Tax=Bombardia bombarda TaxID=252184 RepID=A0AA39WIP0_9PEZI|nr:hypothetical protein B0T17DRAFT_540292 [Bombardia bombarda]
MEAQGLPSSYGGLSTTAVSSIGPDMNLNLGVLDAHGLVGIHVHDTTSVLVDSEEQNGPDSASASPNFKTVPIGPNHIEITDPAALTSQHKYELHDLVWAAKAKFGGHKEGSIEQIQVTEEDMVGFISRVFRDGWGTTKLHYPPTERTLNLHCPVTHVGRLFYDVLVPPLTQAKNSFQRRRAFVCIRPNTTADRVLKFDFLDEQNESFNPAGCFSWRKGWSEEFAYAIAMRKHDAHYYRTLGGYNLSWAVFYARRRLAHWANGEGPLGSRPLQEDHDIQEDLVDINLCRNCIAATHPAAEAALSKLRSDWEIIPPFIPRTRSRFL